MKLLMCLKCHDVVALRFESTGCQCGSARGFYEEDGLHAHVYANRQGDVLCLGFANSSFGHAVTQQVVYGDSKERMLYAGKFVPKGRGFSAFIIPFDCDTVEYHYNV